jgi:hypothetical protein
MFAIRAALSSDFIDHVSEAGAGFRLWKIPTGHCWKKSRNRSNCFNGGNPQDGGRPQGLAHRQLFALPARRADKKISSSPASESNAPITCNLKLPHFRL